MAKASYRRPWAIMEGSVDVAPTGARIVRKAAWGNPVMYMDEDHFAWPVTALMEMDADAAAMRRAMTKNDRHDIIPLLPGEKE